MKIMYIYIHTTQWKTGMRRSQVHFSRWSSVVWFTLIPGDVVGAKCYYVLNGKSGFVEPMEILDVMPGCEVAWISFTAGDSIIHQAIVGGHLSSEDGIPLYVIKGPVGRDYSLGYYDPISKMGYSQWGGVNGIRNYTDMKILQLL